MIRYAANKNRVHSRVAVIVSKKVMKSAVGRNRIRRRVFEVIRRHWDSLVDNMDIAVTVYSAECMTMPVDELEANLIETLRSAGLYKQP